MKVQLTNTQYSALLNIYGPPANVHEMIMSSNNNIISGDDDDFDDLLSLISEEVGEQLCSATDAQRLIAICKKVDPSSINWIGM